MSARRTPIGTRPGGNPQSEHWLRQGDRKGTRPAEPAYTARLTIDVTSELRGRIKVAAFQRGVTVAEMLRELLEREFSGQGSVA